MRWTGSTSANGTANTTDPNGATDPNGTANTTGTTDPSSATGTTDPSSATGATDPSSATGATGAAEDRHSVLRLRDLRLDILGADGHERPILRGIDLSLGPGEAVGIVGESGSGKSMTLRCISRLTPAGARVRGDVLVAGRDVNRLRGNELRRFRQSEVGYVFQDPRAAINPLHTVGDFLLEPARDRGQDLGAARAAALDMLSRMGITDPHRRFRQYPFELSGGLLQRVMIASVLMAEPRLLLADEPTTALDVTTQSDVLALTDRLRRDRGIALLFVTHDLDLAMAVCDRIAVVYAGEVLEVAPADRIRHRPVHPYTRGLLESRPPLDARLARVPVIPGVPASAADAGAGCAFAPRCRVALPVCTQLPAPRYVRPGLEVACHRAEELAAEEPADAERTDAEPADAGASGAAARPDVHATTPDLSVRPGGEPT